MHVVNRDRIDAAERFVEHEQFRFGDERAGDCEPAFFAAAQCQRLIFRNPFDSELVEQLFAAILSFRFANRQRFQNRHDVLFDRHLAKNRFLLRQITHPEPRTLVHRIIGHVRARKHHPAAVRPNESDDHVKGRRLASAVWSEQTDNLSGACVDVHSINYRATAINFYELISGKDSVDLRLRWWRHLRCGTGCSLADHDVPGGFGEGVGFVSFFCSSVFGS